jgi:hypothetical protein
MLRRGTCAASTFCLHLGRALRGQARRRGDELRRGAAFQNIDGGSSCPCKDIAQGGRNRPSGNCGSSHNSALDSPAKNKTWRAKCLPSLCSVRKPSTRRRQIAEDFCVKSCRLVALGCDLHHGEPSPPGEAPQPLTWTRADLPWTAQAQTQPRQHRLPGLSLSLFVLLLGYSIPARDHLCRCRHENSRTEAPYDVPSGLFLFGHSACNPTAGAVRPVARGKERGRPKPL